MKRTLIILLVFLSIASQAQISVVRRAYTTTSGGYGSELITNVTFNSVITPWEEAGSQWAWQTDGAGGGWARHTAGDNEWFYSSSSDILTIGKMYHVVFTVGGMTAGVVYCNVGDTGGSNRSVNGTYTEDIICASSQRFSFGCTVAFDGYIDNVSVKEIL